jgi:hypothetical protein
LQAIVFLGTTPVGGPVLGWICERFGARAGFVVGGLAGLVAAAWGWYVTRGGRRASAPDDVLVEAAAA